MIDEKEKEKVEVLEILELVDGGPTKITRVGITLSIKMRRRLVQFLKENLDVFAWSHDVLPGISIKIIQQKLNVDFEKKPIQ